MTLEDQLDEMGRSYRIEAPHTEQVTRLALAIFDGFSPWPEIKPRDREILMAAGRLHDIGYASHPENHVEEGLRILEKNPLPDFSPGRWRMVLAVVSMHRRNWRGALKDKRFTDLDDKRWVRAKALAAILRIGDGLDHSHVQDARIRSCRRSKGKDQIEVECGWYAGNISWAAGKADLWKAVFRRPLRLKGSILHTGLPYPGILNGDETVAVSARRILYAQYVVMRDLVQGMKEMERHAVLHDYRRALRRFRAALALFNPVLASTSARQLDDRLDQLNEKLGPLRDAHVLQEFVETHREIDGIKRVRSRCRKAAARADKALAALFDSKQCRDTVRLMNRFLRVELPALETGLSAAAPFFETRLNARLKKLGAYDAESMLQMPEQLHHLRKKYRRARHMAECAIPASGRDMQAAVEQLTDMDHALGTVNDLNLAIGALQTELPELAAHPRISAEREDALRRFFEVRQQGVGA